jgi:hypothetical protein
MASAVADAEVSRYRSIGDLLSVPSGIDVTSASTQTAPASAELIARRCRDRFPLGALLKDPVTPDLAYRELLKRTAGRVREGAVRKYQDFATYLDSNLSGRAGLVFEASEAYRANRLLKQAGSEARIIVTAVEGARDDAADLVLWVNNRVKQRFQLKAGGKAAWDALGDSRYAELTIVTHPEELEWLRRESNKQKLANKPLSGRYARLDEALKSGRLTDEIVPGQKVLSRRSTDQKTVNLLSRQWDEVAAGIDHLAQSRLTTPLVKASLRATKFATKAGARLIDIGTSFAAGADFVFAGYGYYDTISRYRAGQLDHDLMVGKMVVHTGEMGVGTVGVILLFFPEPTGATKVAGVVVIGVSVAFGGADISLDMIAAARTKARQQLLMKIDREQRYQVVLERLADQAARVHQE